MKKFLSALLASSLLLSQHSMVFASEVTVFQEETPLIEQSTQTLASSESDFEINNGIITKYVGSGGDVVIPEYINGQKVTTIGNLAITGYNDGGKAITSVYLPDTITTIEESAFSSCSMTSIRLSENLTTIGKGAFSTSNLTSITFPNSVTVIPSSCCSACEQLTEVNLGNAVTEIGYLAFSLCRNLKHMTIPGTVQTIGDGMFQSTGVETVTFSEGITSIGFIFNMCMQLHTVYLPLSLHTIEELAFSDCGALKTVHYAGSQAQKEQMNIATNYDGKTGDMEVNQDLLNANWVYNSPVPTASTPVAPTPSVSTSKVATPSTAKVMVNGAEVPFGAYNIDGYNYFKLTDISFAISGSENQFRVSWDASKNAINMLLGQPHTVTGSELQGNSGVNEVADLFTSPIYCDGAEISPVVYIIDGSSYFQLNSLVDIIGFLVGWDGATSTITITTHGDSTTTTPTPDSSSSENGISLGASTSSTAQSYNNSISRWGSTNQQDIFVVGNQYVIMDATSGDVVLTTYSSNHSQISTATLKNPLETFGGFTYGSDGNYYAVYGKSNPNEIDTQEVYRVVKYDSQFKEVKSFSVNGADSTTVEPFSSGSAELMEVNGTLVVHASRKRYASSDGLNHQSQFTMILDSTSMTLKNKFSQYQSNHVSHSFNQFVGFDGDKILLVDHGDAYPRSVVLNSTSNGGSSYTEKDLLAIPGSVGANCTGLTVGGFTVGNSHYFTAINRADWDSVTSFTSFSMTGLGADERDIIVLATNKTSLTTKEVKIASYIGTGNSGSTPEILSLGNDRFVVLWEEFNQSTKASQGVYYAVINGSGDITTAKTFCSNGTLPAYGSPILYENKVQWFVDKDGQRTLYAVSVI